jgi:hypothetical protein
MKDCNKALAALAALALIALVIASCSVASSDAGVAPAAITWISATGAPPVDGKATLKLEFSEAVDGLTGELFSFIYYDASGKEQTEERTSPEVGALSPDQIVVTEWTLSLTNVPAEPGGRIKISINKANIKPAEKWWNLDGTVDGSFVVVKYDGAALYVGDSAALEATVFPSNATPQWSSGSPGIATIDATGRVTARSPGLTIITANVGSVRDVVAISVLTQPGAATTGIVWKGSNRWAPPNPVAGWAYYNTDDNTTYIYIGNEWRILAQDGTSGMGIVWKGSLDEAPTSPETGWTYYDTNLNESRIWDGDSWQTLSKDASAGAGSGTMIVVDPDAKTVVIPGVFTADDIQTAIETVAGDTRYETGWSVYVSGVNVANESELGAVTDGITRGLEGDDSITLNLSLCYGATWNSGATRIGALVLPVSVTTITDSCGNMKSFYAPGLTTIKERAFRERESLVSVYAPAVVTMEKEAFYQCGALTSASFPNVTSIGQHAFYECGALTSVDIPLVTSIEDNAFTGCIALKAVEFPLITTIEVLLFYQCSSLTSVSFPLATTIGESAFEDCIALKNVSLPKVTALTQDRFTGCTNIETLNIGSVTAIPENIFGVAEGGLGLTHLKTVNAESAISIGNGAFKGCTSLVSASFPNVTDIGSSSNGSVFSNCSSLVSVNFPKVTKIWNMTFYYCTSLESVNFTEVETLEVEAFSWCSSIRSVFLPSVKSIASDAFKQCVTLTTVDFPTVTSIASDAFRDCNMLIRVSLGYGCVMASTASFPGDQNSDSLKTKYEAGGAGTYWKNASGAWAK